MSSTGEGAPLPPPSGSPAAAIAADDDLTAAVDAINLDAPHVGGSATPTTGSDVDDSDDEGLAAASAGGPPVEPIDPTVTAADARAAKAAGNTAYAAGDHTAAVAAYTTALSAAPGVVPPAERAVFWANRAAARLALHAAATAGVPRPPRPGLFAGSTAAAPDGGGGRNVAAATAAVEAWEAHAVAAESDCTAALREEAGYAKALARRAAARRLLQRWGGVAADLRALAALRRDGGAPGWGEPGGVGRQSPAELDAEAARLDVRAAADAERQQGEAMAALKDMGNAFLKPFGIDLNAFKAEKDPSTGSYNIKFGG
ncbi:hypothetical protein I4F81_010767 [Pyropia yezoensis]|uniref:Uncharacterized protein n=1 Tax=Pyropia yezoensis TaxID=2788 RepID=A0ACC3CDM3_PYRYE|nr:hypothetical protein I4F81_010767 [Neopyropia yezoensis]